MVATEYVMRYLVEYIGLRIHYYVTSSPGVYFIYFFRSRVQTPSPCALEGPFVLP